MERELASKEPDWAATPSRNMGDVAVEEDKIHVEDSATKALYGSPDPPPPKRAASTRFPKGNRRPSRPGPRRRSRPGRRRRRRRRLHRWRRRPPPSSDDERGNRAATPDSRPDVENFDAAAAAEAPQ